MRKSYCDCQHLSGAPPFYILRVSIMIYSHLQEPTQDMKSAESEQSPRRKTTEECFCVHSELLNWKKEMEENNQKNNSSTNKPLTGENCLFLI